MKAKKIIPSPTVVHIYYYYYYYAFFFLVCLMSARTSLGFFIANQPQRGASYTFSRKGLLQHDVNDSTGFTPPTAATTTTTTTTTTIFSSLSSSSPPSSSFVLQHRKKVPLIPLQMQSDSEDGVTATNQNSNNDDDNENVQLGSKDYYSGFISRGINEEPEERITGDAVLVPTLKFVGGFAAILSVLFAGFLASNGLL